MAAGLGEGETDEFVEDDEVDAAEVVSDASLPAGVGLGLEFVNRADGFEEAAACAVADADTGYCDGEMAFPVPVPPTKTILRSWAAMKPPAARSRTESR